MRDPTNDACGCGTYQVNEAKVKTLKSEFNDIHVKDESENVERKEIGA